MRELRDEGVEVGAEVLEGDPDGAAAAGSAVGANVELHRSNRAGLHSGVDGIEIEAKRPRYLADGEEVVEGER